MLYCQHVHAAREPFHFQVPQLSQHSCVQVVAEDESGSYGVVEKPVAEIWIWPLISVTSIRISMGRIFDNHPLGRSIWLLLVENCWLFEVVFGLS